jgi:cytochrome c nitrite reductase small subunit
MFSWRSWLAIGPLALATCVGLGIVLGLGGYTFQYAEGLSYLSNDPRACVNCHIMRDHYDGWQHASHHAVATCNDCHTPHDLVGKYISKAENGFWHSKGFTLQDFPEPIRIRPHNAAVLQHNCVDCHETLVSELQRHHSVNGVEEPSCVHCHPAVGHGPPR